MADPVVSVVIPTHQRRDALRRALASLAQQSANRGSYEVVVAVDASTDGTIEMLEAFDAPYELRWVSPGARGRAAACNAALAAAAGEVTIVLDDDMEVVPEFVERHRSHHPAGSRRCVLGAVPVALEEGSSHAARYVKDKFDRHLARLPDPAHLALPRSFYTGNASLRTEVMGEVGGFDESFGIYGNEDVELSLRLRAAGIELGYDPGALAYQEYGKDLGGLQRDTLEKGRTTVLMARSHPEVFADLRLAMPYDSSRPWLAVRALLLGLTRRAPRTTAAVFALFSLLERLGGWRFPLFYRPVLDYAFWAGVDAALRESNDEGELSKLASELKRGPIDLLLHR
ncbi:MAG TPA: glycosyltransferase [Solirubrobacterales bacterium]|jgi:GT2 family glycosyltransferase|nr:glycosyltransferase [Solirubrobacterales bacterium]